MTILLVDKQPITRIGLKLHLKRIYEQAEILEFENLSKVDHVCPPASRTIIILGFYHADKNPHIMDIVSVVQRFPTASIIVYDDDSDDPLVFNYFAIGILGYLAKQSCLYELNYCVKEVIDGRKYIPVDILLHDFGSGLEANSIHRVRPSQKLTYQEYEIATYLSNGMKNSWIAQKLEIRPTTVSYYKFKIFKKLNVTNILKLRELMHCESYP